MEWEKTFANHTCDKRLIPKIYEELLKINSKTTKNPIKITVSQWAKESNRHFSKKDIQKANKYMKK